MNCFVRPYVIIIIKIVLYELFFVIKCDYYYCNSSLQKNFCIQILLMLLVLQFRKLLLVSKHYNH